MKKMKPTLNTLYIALAFTFAVISFSLIRFIFKNPTIAVVGNQISKVCTTGVTSFNIAGLCESNKVKMVSFTCANGRGSGIDGVNDCTDPVTAYQYAQNFCGQTCIAPDPSPSARVCTNPSDITGSCLNAKGQCVTYIDGCQMEQFCTKPYTDCNPNPTSTPKPSLRPGCYLNYPSCPPPSCDPRKGCSTIMPVCDPVMICVNVTPSPSPRFCTEQTGSCLNVKGQCTSYTDGCELAERCAKPLRSCNIVDDVTQSPTDGETTDPSDSSDVVNDFPIAPRRRCFNFFGRNICWPYRNLQLD